MRPTPNLAVERYRIRDGVIASCRFDGNNGAFRLPGLTRPLDALVSDGIEHRDINVLDPPWGILPAWEHVSVKASDGGGIPTWAEMCYVKDLFWDDEECVVEFHPPKSQYVNDRPDVLHLWRPLEGAVTLPPRAFV